MIQTSQWTSDRRSQLPVVTGVKRRPFLRFLIRYPIFLLAFGPPVFKMGVSGDTSQAHFDLWNVIQVAWLSAVTLRALLRLIAARSFLLPKSNRRVLKLMFLLGVLFLLSAAYSPGRVISAEYAILYLFNFTCVAEFLVDVYQNPPNWMECVLNLRLISLILVSCVLLTLPIAPSLVMTVLPGHGIRLLGGMVASMGFYPEIIAIISAYTFLYSLESKVRASFFFLFGLAGTLVAQTRGVDIWLFIVLVVLISRRAKVSRRSSYLFISSIAAVVLLVALFVGVVGGGRIWRTFNRGSDDSSSLLTASGRTGVWQDQIKYCFTHPQGMGYIAGVRAFHRKDYSGNLHAALTNIGGTDSSYMESLTDAGWLSLGLYLMILGRTFATGLRTLKRSRLLNRAAALPVQMPVRCAMLVFGFCLLEGTEASQFSIPLFGPFYFQYILIAIILGASASAATFAVAPARRASV